MRTVLCIIIIIASSGCGTIFGVRKLDAWGFKMDFAEGQDFHIGANTVDHVDSRRGVNIEKRK